MNATCTRHFLGRMTLSRRPRTALALAATVVLGSVHAQASEDLDFRLVIYGWLPEVGGKTTFPQGDGGQVSSESSSIIDNLKMAFMGSLEVQRWSWGAFTDVIYLNLGDSQSRTRGLTVNDEPLLFDSHR